MIVVIIQTSHMQSIVSVIVMSSTKQEEKQCNHEIEWEHSMYPVDKSFDKFMIAGECLKCNGYFERYFECNMFVEIDIDTNQVKGHWLSDFKVKKETWENG